MIQDLEDIYEPIEPLEEHPLYMCDGWNPEPIDTFNIDSSDFNINHNGYSVTGDSGIRVNHVFN